MFEISLEEIDEMYGILNELGMNVYLQTLVQEDKRECFVKRPDNEFIVDMTESYLLDSLYDTVGKFSLWADKIYYEENDLKDNL